MCVFKRGLRISKSDTECRIYRMGLVICTGSHIPIIVIADEEDGTKVSSGAHRGLIGRGLDLPVA